MYALGFVCRSKSVPPREEEYIRCLLGEWFLSLSFFPTSSKVLYNGNRNLTQMIMQNSSVSSKPVEDRMSWRSSGAQSSLVLRGHCSQNSSRFYSASKRRRIVMKTWLRFAWWWWWEQGEELEGSESGRQWRSKRFRTRAWIGGGQARRVDDLTGRGQSLLPVVNKSQVCLGSLMMSRRRIVRHWWERQILMMHKTTSRGRPGGRLESSRRLQTFDGRRRGNNRETNSNPCSFSDRFRFEGESERKKERMMLSWRSEKVCFD